MMQTKKYSFSFTAHSLLLMETVRLAELFLELNDWNLVRDKVLSENLLQARTANTAKRMTSEITSRLKQLSHDELLTLVNSGPQDQSYLLWIALCRRYKFIEEFAVEVLRERYLSVKHDLQPEDFDAFFNRKSEWRPELEEIKPATKEKLRHLLFKTLKEAHLLTADNLINAAMPSPGLLHNRKDILVLPGFDTDLLGALK